MMVKLLVYAYCVGKPSSRKIERATHEEVAFRVLSGDQHPDHDPPVSDELSGPLPSR
jgi:transposase